MKRVTRIGFLKMLMATCYTESSYVFLRKGSKTGVLWGQCNRSLCVLLIQRCFFSRVSVTRVTFWMNNPFLPPIYRVIIGTPTVCACFFSAHEHCPNCDVQGKLSGMLYTINFLPLLLFIPPYKMKWMRLKLGWLSKCVYFKPNWNLFGVLTW